MAGHQVLLPVICFLLANFSFSRSTSEFRNVSTEFLTADIACKDGACKNLVKSVAVGRHDTLYYVYSTLGRPAVLVARTHEGAKMDVDLEKFLSENATLHDGSIKFGEEVSASALLSFDAIYMYNDTNDKASLVEGSNITRRDTKDLRWSLAEEVKDQKNLVRFVSHDPSKNETVTIEFLASTGQEESAQELPHLLLSSNLTQINVYLDNLRSDLKQPRVGLGLSLFAPKKNFLSSDLVEEKFLNDELAPGAFRTLNWLNSENVTANVGSSSGSQVGAFVQWRPICYVSLNRSLQNLTVASHQELEQHFNLSNGIPLSLATAFYGHKALNFDTWMSSVNVTFGISGDRFYSKTNFLTWQLTFGIGSHPQGSLSLLIILLIAIGLGIPIVALIGCAIYLPIRKRIQRRRGYEELSSSYPRIG